MRARSAYLEAQQLYRFTNPFSQLDFGVPMTFKGPLPQIFDYKTQTGARNDKDPAQLSMIMNTNSPNIIVY